MKCIVLAVLLAATVVESASAAGKRPMKLDDGMFGTALAMSPPALLLLALQKEFISGLTSGAVKG